MLNASIIIRRLEKALGFKFMDVELSHDEIIENIKDETLKEFSKFFPYQEICVIDPANKVEPYDNRFFLKTQNECIGINRLVGGSLLGANYVTGLLHPIAADMLLGDPISRQLNMDLMSFTSNPITFKYIEPGMIEIMPVYNNVRSYIVVVNTVHPDTFMTIPVNLEDEFMSYAIADTKAALYPLRGRFSNLQTPYGTMELNLEQFQGAEDEKKQIIEKWRSNSGKNSKRKKMWIA